MKDLNAGTYDILRYVYFRKMLDVLLEMMNDLTIFDQNTIWKQIPYFTKSGKIWQIKRSKTYSLKVLKKVRFLVKLLSRCQGTIPEATI